MANTTNFGWETPDDTDLVKDGAAAIRTLGSAIDTSFVDLKGGTTGQVLAKASNTDLDFTWATDASGIPATIFDAKGDLIAASAADTAARLAVGTNGQYLSANSSTSTGLEWVTPAAGGGMTLLSTTTVSGTSTTISSISQDYTQLFIQLIDVKFTTSSSELHLAFNPSTSTYEQSMRIGNPDNSSWQTTNNDRIKFMGGTGVGTGNNNFGVLVHNYTSTNSYKPVFFFGHGYDNNASTYEANMGGGAYTNTIAISAVRIDQAHSLTMSGTVKIWGIK
jgi:hypothetical protein